MKKSKIIVIIALILIIGFLNSSIYVVKEDETAVVSTLGRIVSVVVDSKDMEIIKDNEDVYDDIKISQQKGLHFKIPLLQNVEKFTSKYLTYRSSEEIINTKDDKRIEIQMYAQYRILDPVTFKLAIGTKEEANKKVDDIVYKVVIQSANTLEFNEFFYKSTIEDLLDSKKDDLNSELLKDYGLYITDIGINRKNFPQANIESIEQKMALQIEKESEKLIAEGDSKYLQAKALADKEKSVIISKATEEAAIIMAQADAEAMRIYQESLNKSLDFYQFIKRMELYRNMKDSTIFVDSSSEIFDLLNGYK